MSFRMQIKIGDRWKEIHPSHSPIPYAYETQGEAIRMLELCYPDQCREQRLRGIYAPYTEGDLVRVVEFIPPPGPQDPPIPPLGRKVS